MKIKDIQLNQMGTVVNITVTPDDNETPDEAYQKARDWVNIKAKEANPDLLTREQARAELEEEVKKSFSEKLLNQLLSDGKGDTSRISEAALDSAQEIYSEPVKGDVTKGEAAQTQHASDISNKHAEESKAAESVVEITKNEG